MSDESKSRQLLSDVLGGRGPTSDANGESFDWLTKFRVWRKAQPIQGYDPAEWRLDSNGSMLRFTRYGDTTSTFGWEIDHIHPLEKGGGSYLENLQALQWSTRQKRETDL